MTTLAAPFLNLLPAAVACLPTQDLELVDRARQGDGRAFLDLFQAHASRLYKLTLRITGNVAMAEDLTREIFVEAFRNLDGIHNDADFAASLSRMAINVLLKRLPTFAEPKDLNRQIVI